jgi:ribonuclease VapC
VSSGVLDASALLAVVYREPGVDQARAVIRRGAAVSAVNLAEVVAKLSEGGMVDAAIRATLAPLSLDVFDFTAALAYQTGLLRPLTKQAGLSLGDRACLALAQQLGLPALTTDRTWAGLPVGVVVQVIR